MNRFRSLVLFFIVVLVLSCNNNTTEKLELIMKYNSDGVLIDSLNVNEDGKISGYRFSVINGTRSLSYYNNDTIPSGKIVSWYKMRGVEIENLDFSENNMGVRGINSSRRLEDKRLISFVLEQGGNVLNLINSYYDQKSNEFLVSLDTNKYKGSYNSSLAGFYNGGKFAVTGFWYKDVKKMKEELPDTISPYYYYMTYDDTVCIGERNRLVLYLNEADASFVKWQYKNLDEFGKVVNSYSSSTRNNEIAIDFLCKQKGDNQVMGTLSFFDTDSVVITDQPFYFCFYVK